MNLGSVITRVAGANAALEGRVEGAAEMSALIKEGGLPQTLPVAYVIPAGLRGGSGESSSGAYTQSFNEVVAVVLIVAAAGDITGGKALPKVDELVNDIIGSLAGWAPDAEVGVFRLDRGSLLSMNDGAIIYQIDFSISDQLRIIS